MKVVMVEPSKKAYVKDIDSSDETMRKIVGGNLEIMTPFKDMNIELIGNDFGKLKGLPLNRIIVDSKGNQCDYLCGTYIICGTSSDGRELVSLTEEQQEFYKNMFDSVDVCMWQ